MPISSQGLMLRVVLNLICNILLMSPELMEIGTSSSPKMVVHKILDYVNVWYCSR